MTLGLRAAAKELGISHVALLKAAKTGRVQRSADGQFDVEACRKALEQNSNLPKQKAARSQQRPREEPTPEEHQKNESDAPEPSGDPSFLEAQRRREWLRVERDELELARKKGELAPVGEVNAWIAGMITRARDILLRIAPELRDRLAQEKDPAKCEGLINEEVDRALRELAKFGVA